MSQIGNYLRKNNLEILRGYGVYLLLSFLLLWAISYALAGPYSTSGGPKVSPSGAFSYQVPIGLPPGSAGVAPELALVFDSRSGGNGFLGRGWDLSGLSQITRCGKAYSVDGVKTGVAYTSADNYCLNGQRLLLKSGTHNQDGAEYVTEQATHSRIILRTGVATGGAQMILP